MDLLSSSCILISLSTIVSVLIYKYLATIYSYWKKRNIPYIEPQFPFESCINLLFRQLSVGQFIQDIYNKTNEELIGFWMLTSPILMVRSPKIIRNILVKDFNHFSDRVIVNDERADPICSKILFLLRNPEWNLMRKKVTPVFTSSKLRNMATLMNKAAEDLNGYLKKNIGVFKIKELSAKYTTDILTSCAFGVEAHCFEDEQAPFRKAGRGLFNVNLMNGIRLSTYFLFPRIVKIFRISMFNPSSLNFLASMFWETIKYRESSNVTRNDLIDIIINLKKEADIGQGIKFEGKRVVAQAIQFYIAGFETTSATIAFILYELALNKHCQEKARSEIMDNLQMHPNLDYEVLQSMPYVDKIIAETLRKYPIVPFLDRMCISDYKVPELDVVIPKDTPVFISLLGIHYNPEYFPDPEKFDPERFSEENVSKRPPFTYFPFGEGPHNCIGERFARIAIKLSMLHILKDFEVDICEDTPVPLVFNLGGFLLQVKGDVPLRFNKIKN